MDTALPARPICGAEDNSQTSMILPGLKRSFVGGKTQALFNYRAIGQLREG